MNQSGIQTTIVTNKFSLATQEEMWSVYKKYYHYSKASFLERIKKNNYYSFYTLNGQIIGFTGLRISNAVIDGQKHLFIYFGQTVIDAAYRGKSLIPVTGAKLYLKFWRDILSSKTYFWADALTYKAYLVFAKSLEEYYPTYRVKNSAYIQGVIDHIGQANYGEAYNLGQGTVSKSQVLVNDPCINIPMRYRQDPDINFYTNANPGFVHGHGLITIAPLNGQNFLRLAIRVMRKSLQAIVPAGGFSQRKKPAPSRG